MVHSVGEPWWGDAVISRIVDDTESTLGYSMIVRNDTDRHRKELQLQDWATRDELTGMLNRRAFRHRASVEIESASHSALPLSFCLLDIDHFKKINDTWGHDMGDAVLRDLGQVLEHAVRSPDVTVRMGGEEFGILMPDTGLSAAQTAAERIRAVVAETRFTTPDGSVLPVTASFGVAELTDDTDSFDMLYRLADEALYRAKNNGRNRVEV
jgi:diguanylate cyclase (GGDEF)-like protein